MPDAPSLPLDDTPGGPLDQVILRLAKHTPQQCRHALDMFKLEARHFRERGRESAAIPERLHELEARAIRSPRRHDGRCGRPGGARPENQRPQVICRAERTTAPQTQPIHGAMTRPRFHDEDSERMLIGAAFIDSSVLDRVGLAPEAFFSARNALIWRALLEMHAENQPLDAILVAERANSPSITSPDLMSDVIACPTAANAEFHANVVRKHATTRRVLRAAGHIRDLHRRGEAEGDELLDAAMEAFSAINVGQSSEAVTIGQLVKERFAQLDRMCEARENGAEPITGVPTGLPSLDRAIAGLQPGIVTLLAGRPGMGKSALALQMADHASARGHGVHVFSLGGLRRGLRRPVAVHGCPGTDHTNTDRAAAQGRYAGPDAAGGRPVPAQEAGAIREAAACRPKPVVREVRRIRKDNGTKLVIVRLHPAPGQAPALPERELRDRPHDESPGRCPPRRIIWPTWSCASSTAIARNATINGRASLICATPGRWSKLPSACWPCTGAASTDRRAVALTTTTAIPTTDVRVMTSGNGVWRF